jgi:NADH-quinone oxidoreductase subunit G
LDYGKLSAVTEQWPIVGREDVYYGGTTYENTQGLGVQLTSGAERGQSPVLSFEQPTEAPTKVDELIAVPVSLLYDRGNTIVPSKLLRNRLGSPEVVLHPEDAEKIGLEMESPAKVSLNGVTTSVTTWIDNSVPKGTALIPRSLGVPISGPTPVKVAK